MEASETQQQAAAAAQPPRQQLAQHLSGSLSFSSNLSISGEDEEMSRSALSNFRAKEEEIERKKLEVREKVMSHLGRVEEETKRLATIREVSARKEVFSFLGSSSLCCSFLQNWLDLRFELDTSEKMKTWVCFS